MPKAFFDELARTYERDAVVQKGAAGVLLDLLQIGTDDDVLDVGCGTGHVTRRMREMTGGRIEGVDPSAAMIAEARRGGEPPRFSIAPAEDLSFDAEFDVVFCNSAMQWFHDPERALARMRRALRPGGRLGVQAPATRDYCPNFLHAMAAVAAHPDTRDIFSRFRSPWFFLSSEEEYAALAERCGLRTRFVSIDESRTSHDPESALRVFESGAVAGYLGQGCYDIPLDATYVRRVHEIVRDSFRSQVEADGTVVLTFRRVFLVATRA